MRRWAGFWVAVGLVGWAQAGEPERPPVGQEARRTVPLLQAINAPCLAFPLRGATVLLPEADLRTLAGPRVEEDAGSDGRVAQLHRERALALLGAGLTRKRVRGCRLATELPLAGSYLVLRQLELGRAAALADGDTALAPHALVHYSDPAILVWLHTDRPVVLGVSWRVF